MKKNYGYEDEARRYPDEAAIWKAVEAKLNLKYREVEPSIMRLVEEEEYVVEILDADNDIEQQKRFEILVNEIRKYRQLVTDAIIERAQMASNGVLRAARHPVGVHHGSDRSNAYIVDMTSEMRDLWSRFVANEMANERSVIALRRHLLEERLLATSEVPIWVASHMPQGSDLVDVMWHMELRWSEPEDIYAPLDRARVYWLPEYPPAVLSLRERIDQVGGQGSALGRLVSEGSAISQRTGWLLGESIWLILTDEPPRLPTLVATSIRQDTKCGTKVVIEVDPEVSPDEVRSVYKTMRDAMKVRTNHRSPDSRIMAFMRFVLETDGVDLRQPRRLAPFVDEWNQLEAIKEKNWKFTSSERRRISETFERALKRLQPSISREYWPGPD